LAGGGLGWTNGLYWAGMSADSSHWVISSGTTAGGPEYYYNNGGVDNPESSWAVGENGVAPAPAVISPSCGPFPTPTQSPVPNPNLPTCSVDHAEIILSKNSLDTKSQVFLQGFAFDLNNNNITDNKNCIFMWSLESQDGYAGTLSGHDGITTDSYNNRSVLFSSSDTEKDWGNLIKLHVAGSNRESGGTYQADSYSHIIVGGKHSSLIDDILNGRGRSGLTPEIQSAVATTIAALSVVAVAIPNSLPLVIALIAYTVAIYDYLRYPIIFLGSKKRKLQSTTVFNSINKRPVAKVKVSIFDENGKLREVQYTDKSGIFNFLVPPGKYRIEATKDEYSFPSKKATGPTDIKYKNVYYGKMLEIKSNSSNTATRIPVDISIPIDPVNSSVLIQFYSVLAFSVMGFFRSIRLPLMIIGTALTIGLLRAKPDVLNSILFFVYACLWYFEARIFFSPKIYGTVKDNYNQPVGYAVIRAFDESGRIRGTVVSDEAGQFIFNLNPGTYYFEGTKTGYKSHASTKVIFHKPKDTGKVDLRVDKLAR